MSYQVEPKLPDDSINFSSFDLIPEDENGRIQFKDDEEHIPSIVSKHSKNYRFMKVCKSENFLRMEISLN